MTAKRKDTFEEQRDLILAPFVDMGTTFGVEEAVRYMVHVGISTADIDAAGGDAVDAIEAHYRTPKGFDLDRAANDLFRYPPVAAEVCRLRRAQEHTREQNRQRKAKSRSRRKEQGAARGKSARPVVAQGG